MYNSGAERLTQRNFMH